MTHREPMPQSFKRTLLVLLAGTWLGIAPAMAEDLNTQAQNMFNDLGMVGNLTPPQAFRGQAMNTYTGGSLYVRTPTKNYQLANFQAPYIRAGCGGIDAFGGSFSHIASAQFKSMLKNITSAIPGLLFQMMIDSVEPLLGTEMKWFKQAEQFVNGLNVNSCNAAKTIVATGMEKAGFSAQSTCQNIATTLGMSADADEAREKCKSAGGLNDVMSQGRANATTKDLPPFKGNLIWEIAKKTNPGLDRDDLELIMSMTGTTIYSEVTDDSPPPLPISPTLKNMGDLMYGNTNNTAGGAGIVTIDLVKCPGGTTISDPCLISPTQTRTSTTMQALSDRTRALMQSISNKIAAGDAAPTTSEQSFINAVPMPIYQLLSSSNAINNTSIADAKIGQYAEYAAVEFAYGLMSRAAHLGMGSTGYRDAKLTEEQLQQLAMHRENARQLMQTLDAQRANAQAKAQSFVAIAQDIDQLKRSMRKNMSQQMNDVMRFSSYTR